MKRSLLTLGLSFSAICLSFGQGVTPVQLGRASNAFTVLRTEQNQVYADNGTGAVAFVHRQDVTIWGGGTAANGRLRYDISVDGGSTFSNDIGMLNNLYARVARYPQITGVGSSSNSFLNSLAWTAPTLNPSGAWDGIANGVSGVYTSNPLPFSSENYDFINDSTLLQGGLCQGLPNELWMTDFYAPGGGIGDSLRIFKGTYSTITGAVVWSLHNSIHLDHYLGYSGTPTGIGPNISFSPSGNDGWAAYLGDLNGGSDTTINPVLVHSSDGGTTWGTPMEVDLRTVEYMGNSMSLVEELQDLWVDTAGNPTGSGRPTCSFNYDITVDANGNPHMLVIVANASTVDFPLPNYSLYSGLAKLALDVYTEDGGLTWKAVKVAPIYTFRGTFGSGGGGAGITMDNYPQIARSQDGMNVFYSWVDSDTSDIGFGISDNLAPNLRIASQRISDGYMTCPKWITKGDLLWDGRALWPTMAPEVLYDSLNGEFQLPIVITEMITNDHEQPCSFWYFGNDATIDANSDYIAQALFLDSENCLISGVERKPLLEVHTGTWTIFAPDGKVRADEVVVSHPNFTVINVYNGDLSSPLADTITGDLNIGGAYPRGSIDRAEFPSDTNVVVNRGLWLGNAGIRNMTTAPVNVGLDSISFNPTNSQLTVTVNANFFRSLSGDLRLNVMVVEDNITGYPQDNYYDTEVGHPFYGAGNPIVNYVHNGVLQGCMGGAWGTSGIIPGSVNNGDSFSHTYTYILPAGVDPTEVKLIGVVQKFASNPNDREIFNSSGEVPLIDFCDPVAAFTKNVTGYTANFNDASLGNPTSYFWDFGDGTLSVNQNPQHTYAGSGTYTVCLIASNVCGSDTFCQSVDVYPCDNPSQYWEADITSDQVRMVWNTEDNANKYKLKIRKTGTNNWTYHTILAPDTFKVKTGLEPGTAYEYKVKTVCGQNSPSSYGPFQYFTTAGACDNPTTVTMVGINQTQTNAYWTSVPEAVSYKLKYRPVGSSNWKYKTVYAPDTSRNLYNLLPDTQYEYKIRTECANGAVPYGPTAYFTTLSCEIAGNRDEAFIGDNTAILVWNAVPGAVSYKVKYRINNTPTWSYKNVTAPNTSTQLNGLQSGTTYQWKVKSFCSPTSNYSGYSGNNLFVTTGSMAEGQSRLANGEEDDAWINVFPNPTNGQVTIDLFGFEYDQQMRIMDIAGNVVFVDNIKVQGATVSRTMNLDVASGTYFVQFAGENGTQTHRLIVN